MLNSRLTLPKFARRLLVPLVLGVTILSVFGGAVENDFVNDDAVAIAANSRAHDPTDLGTIFSSSYWTNTLYRPVTVTAFAVLWQVGGGSPAPFFTANLLLTLAICLLLFTLLERLGAGRLASFVGTMIFAVHPVHVEVVANGVGLAELLSTAFVLTGAVLTLRRPWPPAAGLLLGICGLMAFLSKESGITALALIPLLWLGRPPSDEEPSTITRREAFLTLLLFLVAGLAVRTTILGGLSGEAPIRALDQLDTLSRARTVLGVVPEWARLLVWPASLQADYGPPQIPIGGPFSRRHALGVVILFTWGALLVTTIRQRRWLIATGLLWIPVALSPVSNLLFPTGILVAERTLFLPSVGLAMVAAGLMEALPRWRMLVLGGAAVLTLLGGLRSNSRVSVWRDQDSFFGQIVVDGSRSYRSWYSAGLYARQLGQTDKARQLFAESWRLEKRDYRVAEEYGQMLRAGQQYGEAVQVLEEAFRMAPNTEPLTSRLLESLMAMGRWEEAEALVDRVAEMSTEDAERLRARLREVRARETALHTPPSDSAAIREP